MGSRTYMYIYIFSFVVEGDVNNADLKKSKIQKPNFPRPLSSPRANVVILIHSPFNVARTGKLLSIYSCNSLHKKDNLIFSRSLGSGRCTIEVESDLAAHEPSCRDVFCGKAHSVQCFVLQFHKIQLWGLITLKSGDRSDYNKAK